MARGGDDSRPTTMRGDLRTASRSLRSSPTFTVVALVVLALGIGAGTASFSVVDAVVLRGLPFDEHDRLVAVLEDESRAAELFGGTTTPQTYLDWRERQQPFDGLAAVSTASFGLRDADGHPETVRATRVTAEFFDVVRVRPLLVGAGLFASSFRRLMQIDPGFDYKRILVVSVGPRRQPGRIEEGFAQAGPYLTRMLEAVSRVPGTGASWCLAAAVKGFLFQVEPTDPGVLAGSLAVLTIAGLAASVVPARRAASVDPLIALRRG